MHDDVLPHVFLNFEHLLAMLALELLVTVNLQVILQLLAGGQSLTADMTNVRILLGLCVFPGHMGLQPLPSFTFVVTLVAVHCGVAPLVQPQVVLSLERLVAYVANPGGFDLLRLLRYEVVVDSGNWFTAEDHLEVSTQFFHYQTDLTNLADTMTETETETERAGEIILLLSNQLGTFLLVVQ